MNCLPALAAIVLSAFAASASAASFTYRGHLEDAGAPAEGSYAFRLSLYADREGRQALAHPIEMTGVAIHRGSFAVGLDFPDAPADVHSGWLKVEVKSPDDGAWWPLPEKQPVALKAQICPESWALSGNADSNPQANFLGTTDNSALVFRVNNSRALRIEPGSTSPNLIAGHPDNSVLGDQGITIAGGGNFLFPHVAQGDRSTISGGSGNATQNFAASVPGGFRNCAGGRASFAAGFRAKVRPGSAPPSGACADVQTSLLETGDEGTFIWADRSGEDFVSTGANQFLVRASGGVGINTPAPTDAIQINSEADGNALRVVVGNTTRLRVYGTGGVGIGTNMQTDPPLAGNLAVAGGLSINQRNPGSFRLAVNGDAAKPDGGLWSSLSDARLKHQVEALPTGTLDRVLKLRGKSYRFTDEALATQAVLPGVRVGFLAQEVAEVFPDWVAEDAQGHLYVTERGTTALMVEALRELRGEKDAAIARLEMENEALNARLAEVEVNHEQRLAEMQQVQARELSDLRAELALLRELLAPSVANGRH